MDIATSVTTGALGTTAVGVLSKPAAPQMLRLLLVDDCRVNRMLVTAALTPWGIVPRIACNGAQAVLVSERQRFDIVLMDLMMPVMGGVVATAKIRQAERENSVAHQVPIVAFTSLSLGLDPSWLARVGFTAVLPKPCSQVTLRNCLARWCPDAFTTA